MAIMVSGMTGKGSIRHNNRDFYAANVDQSRSPENVEFCRYDLREVYHELFDEALTEYNAKKTKTRDKIPNYYEHIRQGKQEKLFHEVIFQIGNMESCPCGSPEGNRAAEVLKEFTRTFQERNPHLRVFNATLHMDEATPHVHIDFVPFATDQKRGLSTRVSMKQALKQQGFTGTSKQNSEWSRWMESEKAVLERMAKERSFEIEHGKGGRPHLDTPAYIAAKKRETEAVAYSDWLENLNDKTAEEVRSATQTLQNAREALNQVKAEEQHARAVVTDLTRSAASPERLEAIEASAKRTALSNRVSLPEPEYKELLQTARSATAAKQEAIMSRKETRQAKQAALKAETRMAGLEEEVQLLRREVGRLTPAAKLGEWFAGLWERSPLPQIIEQWGEGAARMIYAVLKKPFPEQQKGSFMDALSRAKDIANTKNQSRGQGQPPRKHDRGWER